MKKIKAIRSGYPSEVDDDIQIWIRTHSDINILSVSGILRQNGETITYILYEQRQSEQEILNS